MSAILSRIGRSLLLVLLLLTLSSLPSWADAAPIPEAEPTVSVGLNTDAISPEKINQFVHSYLQVTTLLEQREGELQAAETDSDSQRIQQDIEAQAIALIETSGLTLQEYLQLLSLANLDPEFSDRIALQLQEAIE
ncbi:DUF4168 domain-containing protein [Phormidium tenue FACHB-886]|nr:DUF4168 domain-containing protein [Phormidium tenue FACHB-886]